MILKKAKYKKVKVWQNKEISGEVYGCDECKQEIEDFPNENQRLEVKVFTKDNKPSDTLHFCSWDCVLKHLPKVKSDYFVNLPFMYFDEPKGSKRSGNELIKILKKINTPSPQSKGEIK